MHQMSASKIIHLMTLVVVEVETYYFDHKNLSPSDSDLMRENRQINLVVNSNFEYLRFLNI